MGVHKHEQEFDIHSDISEDIIAEALRSVERHERMRVRSDLSPEETIPSDETPNEPTALAIDDPFAADLESLLVATPAELGENASALDLQDSAKISSPKRPLKKSTLKIRELQEEARRLQLQIDELNTAVDVAEANMHTKMAELQKANERCLWLGAELENTRKRAARDRAELEKYAGDKVLKEALPVLDNLERAMFHAQQSTDNSVLREGVAMTVTQYHGFLRRVGVTRIELSPGDIFDPTIHEAMMQEESFVYPSNTIVRELLPGFRYHERLLRASLVTVSRPVAKDSPEKISEAEPDGVPEPVVEPIGLEPDPTNGAATHGPTHDPLLSPNATPELTETPQSDSLQVHDPADPAKLDTSPETRADSSEPEYSARERVMDGAAAHGGSPPEDASVYDAVLEEEVKTKRSATSLEGSGSPVLKRPEGDTTA